MRSERATLRRLTDQSFGQVWHSASYQEFRSRLLSDNPPEVCQGRSLHRRVF